MHFDWSTLALQTVNVLVLLWLLRRFLFRPIVDIVAARKNAAEKLLAEAAAARERAQAEAEQVTRHEKELAATGERILADARAAAETERAALLTHAKNETVQARDAAVATLEQERRQMRRELAAEARRLAVTIASRLLGRVPAAAVNAALLQSLETWLAKLMPDEVRALAEPGEVLEVATATPLDAPAQAACAEMLARRLARTPALRFDTDPSLIAGVELRGTHARLRNNWRADLDRIAQELSRDDEPLTVA
jgi:F-type H+-transporting ATPase subunit b